MPLSDDDRATLLRVVDEMAHGALRTLCLAVRFIPHGNEPRDFTLDEEVRGCTLHLLPSCARRLAHLEYAWLSACVYVCLYVCLCVSVCLCVRSPTWCAWDSSASETRLARRFPTRWPSASPPASPCAW